MVKRDLPIPEKLSVIIPCYNEEKRIGMTLDRVHQYLRERIKDFEILVVNDGSRDKTMHVVSQLAAKLDRIRLLNNPGNQGKGFSVRNGMVNAAGDYRLFSDADLSTPIEELEVLSLYIKEYPVVIGSRRVPGSHIEIHQPIYREWMGQVFNLFFQSIVIRGIIDSQCGFKLFTKKAAIDIFSRMTINGFGFDAEALFLARKLGYPVKEAPVKWLDDPQTKVHPLRDATTMFFDLFRVRIRHF